MTIFFAWCLPWRLDWTRSFTYVFGLVSHLETDCDLPFPREKEWIVRVVMSFAHVIFVFVIHVLMSVRHMSSPQISFSQIFPRYFLRCLDRQDLQMVPFRQVPNSKTHPKEWARFGRFCERNEHCREVFKAWESRT